MKKFFTILLCLVSFNYYAQAQVEEDDDEEEDFSMYADFGLADDTPVKRYATPKILGLAPAKLVSLGYDIQGPNTLITSGLPSPGYEGEETDIQMTHGTRFFVNLPVISHNRFLMNVGLNYMHTMYEIRKGQYYEHPFTKTIDQNGLRTMGLNTTVFKPLNEKNFILGFVSADLSGDYNFKYMQSPRHLRYTWVGLYGWQPHDRKQYGFGVTQSYRAGEVNYFPVVMYNYTAANRKWGIEALLPARAHFRRTFNSRNIMLFGFELDGQTYRLNDRRGYFPDRHAMPQEFDHYDHKTLELRRSELRFRVIYEKAITDFIWVSTQAGYVYNYRYDVDSGDFFRGFFGNQPYVMQNTLTNPFYFNVSLNLVSP
jgi:hypothetical protein